MSSESTLALSPSAIELLNSIAEISSHDSSFLAPLAILISATVAGAIAITISKRQNSVNILITIREDSKIDSGIAVLRKIEQDLKNNPDATPVEYYAHIANADTKQAKRIRHVLNSCEQLASGINEGIYDEALIKKSKCSTIIKIYERAEKFIEEVQKSQCTAYQEFKELALAWKANPVKKKSWISKIVKKL